MMGQIDFDHTASADAGADPQRISRDGPKK
jgi:hypothetical protein